MSGVAQVTMQLSDTAAELEQQKVTGSRCTVHQGTAHRHNASVYGCWQASNRNLHGSQASPNLIGLSKMLAQVPLVV